jgi:hypothetical protein
LGISKNSNFIDNFDKINFVTVHGFFKNHIIFLGGHWRQRGLRGHWGHTNLKTMINDSKEKNSF